MYLLNLFILMHFSWRFLIIQWTFYRNNKTNADQLPPMFIVLINEKQLLYHSLYTQSFLYFLMVVRNNVNYLEYNVRGAMYYSQYSYCCLSYNLAPNCFSLYLQCLYLKPNWDHHVMSVILQISVLNIILYFNIYYWDRKRLAKTKI